MALVSLGCVLKVSWVETEAIRDWISSHALQEPLTKDVTTNGVYDEGILSRLWYTVEPLIWSEGNVLISGA